MSCANNILTEGVFVPQRYSSVGIPSLTNCVGHDKSPLHERDVCVCVSVCVCVCVYVGMPRITTFRSMTDRIYEDGPVRL